MKYGIVIGSFDVQRGGPFVELRREMPGAAEPFLEAFRADGQSAITVTGWGDFECPLEELQRFVRVVEERLGPGIARQH